jgi:hypothetical protein
VIVSGGIAAAIYAINERAPFGEENRQEPNFGG